MADDKRISPGPAAGWIMRSLRLYREQRSLTYIDLSERLTELGRPIPPQGLRRIERGDRRIDVDDLIALARALGVAPVMLVFPLGQAQETELLSGYQVSTWEAVRWFVGRGPFPSPDGDTADLVRTIRQTSPVQLYDTHDRLVSDYLMATHEVLVLRQMPGEPDADRAELRAERIRLAEERARDLEGQLARHRGNMHKTGWLLPPLPPDLKHLSALREGDGDDPAQT